MDSICKKIIFIGIVQGVGFRWTTIHCGHGLGVKGHVKNLPDGSVELVVQGSHSDIDTLMGRIQKEMKKNIQEIKEEEIPLQEFSTFEILR